MLERRQFVVLAASAAWYWVLQVTASLRARASPTTRGWRGYQTTERRTRLMWSRARASLESSPTSSSARTRAGKDGLRLGENVGSRESHTIQEWCAEWRDRAKYSIQNRIVCEFTYSSLTISQPDYSSDYSGIVFYSSHSLGQMREQM